MFFQIRIIWFRSSLLGKATSFWSCKAWRGKHLWGVTNSSSECTRGNFRMLAGLLCLKMSSFSNCSWSSKNLRRLPSVVWSKYDEFTWVASYVFMKTRHGGIPSQVHFFSVHFSIQVFAFSFLAGEVSAVASVSASSVPVSSTSVVNSSLVSPCSDIFRRFLIFLYLWVSMNIYFSLLSGNSSPLFEAASPNSSMIYWILSSF